MPPQAKLACFGPDRHSDQMAAHLVVSCCLPGASPSSRAKAAAASSSSPPASNLKATKSRGDHTRIGRRDFVLRSSELATLAAIFHFSGTKPSYLGVQKNPPSLALCPATNNCVSTSEEISDSNHYAPPWNYNPKDGRRGKPITKEEAMKELIEVVTKTKPDNFTPRIVEKTDDYVRVEYESPIFGFVDDVEFWFPPGNKAIVQYRSASRSGFVDFNANKKRVKELRLALEKKGWASESNF
ncbi:hypothetical protein GQ55_9G003000 [Panicum hallii var. hallii]|uniref:DUF1499 domain-containing protein n=1 Tax=Panicum hallii var. hallii TaxID=1504633 RepID=A0A2T7BY25_9POAL|nr:hypothetical protein GQ55_9G003000 [Panicum hallii var. hallii]